MILLKPDDFRDEALKVLDAELQGLEQLLSARQTAAIEQLRQRLGDKALSAARLAAALQADGASQWPDPPAALQRHVLHFDHGHQRR